MGARLDVTDHCAPQHKQGSATHDRPPRQPLLTSAGRAWSGSPQALSAPARAGLNAHRANRRNPWKQAIAWKKHLRGRPHRHAWNTPVSALDPGCATLVWHFQAAEFDSARAPYEAPPLLDSPLSTWP